MKLSKRQVRTILFSLSISALLVSGCATTEQNVEHPTIKIASSATLPIIVRTATILPIAATTSTPTTQAPIEISLEKECIPIEDRMPDDLVLSGVWVRSHGKPYLENLIEHTKYEIPLKGGGIFDTYSANTYISPDGKHLAYIDSYLEVDSHFDSKLRFQRNILRTQKRILRIINSAGHSLPMDFWTVDWQWIIGWIDNQNLALSVSNSVSKNDVIILNPFTGSWKKFEPSQWVKFNDLYSWSLPYGPTLEWFWDDSDSRFLVLKDVKTGNTVWQSDDGGGSLGWSRDGSALAVVSVNSINIISKGKQIAKFDIRKLGLDPSWNVALSSDSQKVFFTTNSKENFVFLDTKKSIFYSLCPNEYELTYNSRPFWSPDNRFLVLGVYDSKSYYPYNSFDLLIDTQQMRAYKLITKPYHERLLWLSNP